jgi:hypothetical protein
MIRLRIFTSAVICALALAVVSAHAQVVFSNVTIGGSLSTGATFVPGPTYIDFLFLNAKVGDGEQFRTGNLSILYNAATSAPMVSDSILLSILGALSGSGQIFFNEIVEDLSDPQNPVVIGSHGVVLTSNSQLPFTHTILFSRPSEYIRVKKELTLTANPDTQAYDFASVGLIQQSIGVVPEPGTMIALGAGVAALAMRRRKRS